MKESTNDRHADIKKEYENLRRVGYVRSKALEILQKRYNLSVKYLKRVVGTKM